MSAYDTEIDEITSIRVEVTPPSQLFYVFKRAFDIAVASLIVAFCVIVGAVLLVLNPFFNRGPLFFAQTRMGKNCVPFRAYKFRTMTVSAVETRSADAPLETHRITPLGRILRKMRLDEFPQAFNVLRGEMSLIGPRPDYFKHAVHFAEVIPGYRERHCVRPGISGLAQTEVGYVEGTEATRRKVRADLDYIRNMGFRQELWLVWRSVVTVLRLKGS